MSLTICGFDMHLFLHNLFVHDSGKFMCNYLCFGCLCLPEDCCVQVELLETKAKCIVLNRAYKADPDCMISDF